MGVNRYYLELMSILLSISQPQKSMNKTTKTENLFLRKKDKRHQKKDLHAKFMRINISDAERGYDTNYEVSKIQAFISKFKDEKMKELEGEIKKSRLQLKNQSA